MTFAASTDQTLLDTTPRILTRDVSWVHLALAYLQECLQQIFFIQGTDQAVAFTADLV